MCVIAICEKRRLTKAEFDNCWNSNRHGFGCAYWTGNKIITAKGIMEQKEAWKVYHNLPLPHVAHFRIASAGAVCPELTHPFICSSRSGLGMEYEGVSPVLFHNGTVSNWHDLLFSVMLQTKIVPKGSMSDSRTMAIICSVMGKEFLELYDSQKWVYVTKEGYTKYGTWIDGKGISFSNASYESINIGHSFGRNTTGWPGGFRPNPPPTTKSCKTCYARDGEKHCILRGKLKDFFACNDYEPDESFLGEEEGAREEYAPAKTQVPSYPLPHILRGGN